MLLSVMHRRNAYVSTQCAAILIREMLMNFIERKGLGSVVWSFLVPRARGIMLKTYLGSLIKLVQCNERCERLLLVPR